MRLARVAAAIAAAGILFAASARATTIERVISPGGIEAWLVREPAVPLIAVDFAFAGGAVQDTPGKSGTATLVASLLDAGAGDLDSKAFSDRLERKAIQMGFSAQRDTIRGTMRTLVENRDAAFDILRLAVTAPRFDAKDVEISRAQVLSLLRRETTSPADIASRRWWETAFEGHPYGRPVNGTPDTVSSISIADLKSYVHRVFARGNLTIAVVGDIDAETLKPLLDRTFGALPEKAELIPIANVAPRGLGRRIEVSLDVPQTVVDFGGPGIRARIRTSWPLIWSITFSAADHRPRGFIRRSARNAGSPIQSPITLFGSIMPRCCSAVPRRGPTGPARRSISSKAKSNVSPRPGRARGAGGGKEISQQRLCP